MGRPNAIPCPGCGLAIPAPEEMDETPDRWLAEDAWCERCGGSAKRLSAPLVYGPRWYAEVAERFNQISIMELVLDPDSVEPLYTQALPGAEAIGLDDREAEIEAAKRVALCIAILAYGTNFVEKGVPEAVKSVDPDDDTPVEKSQFDLEKIYCIAWRPTDPGTMNGGLEWSNIDFDHVLEVLPDGILTDPRYETCQFAIEVPDAWDHDLITSWLDRKMWEDWPGPEDERIKDTQEFFDKMRSGDKEAIKEAIYLIRTHALPEDHPLALD